MKMEVNLHRPIEPSCAMTAIKFARHASWTVLAFAFVLAGCTGFQVRAVRVPPDTLTSPLSVPNQQPSARDAGVFVFDEPQSIRVKVRRFSLLSLIDEVGYRRGFNYRVMADLTPFQVELSGATPAAFPGEEELSDWERTEQRRFASDRDLFDAVVAQINQRALKDQPVRLAYRWISDGPEFYMHSSGDPITRQCNERGEAPPKCDIAQISFKKFFIRNVEVENAVANLRSLLYQGGDGQGSSAPQMGGVVSMGNMGGIGNMGGTGGMGGMGGAGVAAINQGNSQNSTLAVYNPQNAIIIRSLDNSLLDKASQLLFALDASYQQVLIETLIFQYDENTAQRIGTALDLKREKATDEGNRQLTSQLVTQFGSSIVESLPRLFFSFTDLERKATLLTKLALYDSDGFVRVLAEPRLVLQSGELASVKLNTTKHVLTTGVNSPGTIKEIPTGITLQITPTVLGNGKVRMKLELSQSEFTATSETNVVASTVENKVITSVIAPDGEMVSIGGILSRRDGRGGTGIPGLRDIPVAGYAFGMRGGDASRSRIEFMIRPTVERAPQRLRAIRENVDRTNQLLERELRP